MNVISPHPFPPAVLAASPTDLPADWNSQTIAAGISQLTAYFGLTREMLRASAGWLAGVPYWDAKQAMARHISEDAQLAEAMLKRLHELKATAAEHKQVPGLDELVSDLIAAGSGDEFLHGLYTVIKPWLVHLMEGYLTVSDPVMDEPSRLVVGRACAEGQRQIAWFASYSPRFSVWEESARSGWCQWLRSRLSGVEFRQGAFTSASDAGQRLSRTRFEGVARVRRDRTFRVADQSGLPREGATYEEKRFLIFYHHSQEMQFAESLGAILFETPEMPWAFHLDLARHLADEVRHATMGQQRLEQLGVALTEVPMLTQHYEFRSHLDPLERFCLMTLVMEATAFERKRAHVELFEAHQDRVSALYESYDIKDEMIHTNLGHLWVPVLLRVFHDSRSVSELTEHCRAQIAQVILEYPSNAANMVKK